MRIRSSRVTPAHAPAWVRPRHWPAAAGIAGMAVLAATVLALDGGGSATVRPVRAAVAQVETAAPAATLATSAQATAASLAPVVIADVTTAAAPQNVPAEQVLAPAAGRDHAAPSDGATVSGLASGGIPSTALEAYRRAATRELAIDPGCHLPWPLLAGIGRVESNHGRFGGAVLLSDGRSTRRILGIPLDGSRSATITDTDHGRLDGDTVYDRALGPMQFIPSTWASYGADGNGDGRIDPFNIFDAAAAAAHYLCVAGGDLSTLAGQTRAVLAYNHSSDYLALVLKLEHAYAVGVPGLIVPVLPAQSAPPSGASTQPVRITPRPGHKPVPPVDPGPPLSAPSGPTRPHPVATSSSATSPVPRPTSTRPGSSSAAPTTSAPSTTPSSSGSSCAPSSSAAPSTAPDTSASGTSADSAAGPSVATTSGIATSTDPATPASSAASSSSDPCASTVTPTSPPEATPTQAQPSSS